MHPLSFVPQDQRPWWVLGLLVLVVALGWVMGRAGRPMRVHGGTGIVPFELAEDARESSRILRAWGAPGRAAARASIRIDYAWLVLYSAALSLACLYVGGRADARGLELLADAALVFAWLALLAGALDAVENTALLRILRAEPVREPPPTGLVLTARRAAQVKFGLVTAGLLFFFVGLGVVQLA